MGAVSSINGQLVINEWQSRRPTSTYYSPPINLNAGAFYDVKLEYLNVTGNAQAQLSWYSPDQAQQIIPQGNLFSSSSGSATAGPPVIASNTSDTYASGSGNYTYTISGSPGSTYSVSGLPAGLTLTGNVISGTAAAGNYQFIVTATNAAGATTSTVVNLTVSSAAGIITREIYTGLGGPSGAGPPASGSLHGTAPSSTDNTLTTLEDTAAYGNNTGERLRGYFTAPTTGNYYFWIAGSGTAVDSNHTCAELWISNTSQAVSNVRRALISPARARLRGCGMGNRASSLLGCRWWAGSSIISKCSTIRDRADRAAISPSLGISTRRGRPRTR